MRPIVERLVDARDYARRAAGYVRGISLTIFTADAVRREAVYFKTARDDVERLAAQLESVIEQLK